MSWQETHLEEALVRAHEAVRKAAEEGRSRLRGPRTPVLAVTGGKGGVGKSNVSLNLGITLARQGRRILLLDADLGLANVEVLIGSSPRFHLGQVLSGECTLEEAVYYGPAGLGLISGGAGLADLAAFGPASVRRVMHSLEKLSQRFDLVLLDTGAGIHPQVLTFVRSADYVVVVTTPEPTAMTDAYAMMKAAGLQDRMVGLVMNQARSREEAQQSYTHLAAVCSRYLGAKPLYLGHIPVDPAVSQAVRAHAPLVEFAPQAPAARAIAALAAGLAGSWLWAGSPPSAQSPVTPPETAKGHGAGGFWRRLLAAITEGDSHG